MVSIPKYFVMPKLSHRFWKVWSRNKDVFMKTFRTNFLIPLLEPILYLAAMGLGLGLFIQQVDGVPYIQFIAPGLVAVSMMNAAFFECTYASYVRMYYQKTFDAIISTPLSVEEVIAGEILWGATRSLISVSIVLAVITAWGLTNGFLFLLIIPFSFLVGLLFASLAMCCTAIVPSIDTYNYPFFLFITPMFLFSGTFFPITILPPSIQFFAEILLPLTHGVNITRGLTLGRFDPSMLLSLLWLSIVAAVFFILAINLMVKRLVK
jgi:lipooligosaccharide transport system permease protein